MPKPHPQWKIDIVISFYKFCYQNNLSFRIAEIAEEANLPMKYVFRLEQKLNLPRIKLNKKKKVRYIIDKNNCWIWQLYKDKDGYGQVWIKEEGCSRPAHRYYFEQKFYKIPEGKVIDHLCRNTSCVNPDHLEIVDCKENTRRGASSILSKEQVLEIKQLYKLGWHKQTEIAKMYNVQPQLINKIIKESRWIDIQPDIKNYSFFELARMKAK